MALAALLTLSACASTGALREFTTDGCSLFPDGSSNACWADCCVTHDQAYWRGGTADERVLADVVLRECVSETTQSPAFAAGMYYGVRLGGTPFAPTWFRWGYGWDYGRGYAPLSAEELLQVDQRLADHWPESFCGPSFAE